MEVYVLFTSDGYESSSALGAFSSARNAVQAALDGKDSLDMTVSVERFEVDDFQKSGVCDVVFGCYACLLEVEAEKFLSKGA